MRACPAAILKIVCIVFDLSVVWCLQLSEPALVQNCAFFRVVPISQSFFLFLYLFFLTTYLSKGKSAREPIRLSK